MTATLDSGYVAKPLASMNNKKKMEITGPVLLVLVVDGREIRKEIGDCRP